MYLAHNNISHNTQLHIQKIDNKHHLKSVNNTMKASLSILINTCQIKETSYMFFLNKITVCNDFKIIHNEKWPLSMPLCS